MCASDDEPAALRGIGAALDCLSGAGGLAIQLVSGPGGLACALRRGLLDAPYNSKSVVLDIGHSATIPGPIRRAVQLRARHCEWPGCDKPLAWCDIHHLHHKRDGGPTSVTKCVALCQFHHDTYIHCWGWQLVLHPDATTTAHGPKGQVLHSHGPPGGNGPQGTGLVRPGRMRSSA